MRWAINLGVLALVTGIGGAGYGVWWIVDHHQHIVSAQQVPAVVLSQRTERRKVHHNNVTVPIIEYEYRVGPQRYVSEVVTPVECMLPNTWADEVLRKYPVGARVMAFHDPDKPGTSFLIPKYGSEPYLAVLMSIVIGAMGVGAIVEQLINNDAPTATEEDIQGFTLSPKRHHLADARIYGVIGLVGLVAGVPVIGHHISVSTSPHERLAFALEVCFAIAVLVVLILAALGYRRGSGFGSPIVRIDKRRILPGEPFQLSVSLPIQFQGTVSRLTAQIDGEAKDRTFFSLSEKPSDMLLWKELRQLARNAEVTVGEVLSYSADVGLPDDAQPSTPAPDRSLTHVVWTLTLSAQGNSGRQFETKYILNVEAR